MPKIQYLPMMILAAASVMAQAGDISGTVSPGKGFP